MVRFKGPCKGEREEKGRGKRATPLGFPEESQQKVGEGIWKKLKEIETLLETRVPLPQVSKLLERMYELRTVDEKLWEEAKFLIRKLSRKGDPNVRIEVAEFIGKHKIAELKDVIKELLSSKDWRVKGKAMGIAYHFWKTYGEGMEDVWGRAELVAVLEVNSAQNAPLYSLSRGNVSSNLPLGYKAVTMAAKEYKIAEFRTLIERLLGSENIEIAAEAAGAAHSLWKAYGEEMEELWREGKEVILRLLRGEEKEKMVALTSIRFHSIAELADELDKLFEEEANRRIKLEGIRTAYALWKKHGKKVEALLNTAERTARESILSYLSAAEEMLQMIGEERIEEFRYMLILPAFAEKRKSVAGEIVARLGYKSAKELYHKLNEKEKGKLFEYIQEAGNSLDEDVRLAIDRVIEIIQTEDRKEVESGRLLRLIEKLLDAAYIDVEAYAIGRIYTLRKLDGKWNRLWKKARRRAREKRYPGNRKIIVEVVGIFKIEELRDVVFRAAFGDDIEIRMAALRSMERLGFKTLEELYQSLGKREKRWVSFGSSEIVARILECDYPSLTLTTIEELVS